jgi:hypothetical protein
MMELAQPYLALKINRRRADQVALIVRLLQRRRSLVSHHDRERSSFARS